jgi:MFS family permease
MNQLFIVIGMFIGQSLSFPFAAYSKWRYVFVVSIAMSALQILASGLIRVPDAHREIKRSLSEESALLAGPAEAVEEEGTMSIRDLFTSDDQVIRKGRKYHSWPVPAPV